MMYRVTNVGKATRIVHNSKNVPNTIEPEMTRHLDLSDTLVKSIQRFNKSLRVEAVDDEPQSTFEFKGPSEPSHEPPPISEPMSLADQESPPLRRRK